MSKKEKIPQNNKEYWQKNLTLLSILLLIWFIVSLGCGVLFVNFLDKFQIPGTGFKLGFWFAQQGSIFIFLVLILIYVIYMNKLDASYKKSSKESHIDYEI